MDVAGEVGLVSARTGEGGAPGEEPPIEETLLRAIGREVLRLSRRRVQTPEGSVLDRSSFRILWVLTEMGPSSMGDLENVLQLEQSTVSRQVKSAISRGLIELHSVPGTRRRLLRPTPQGESAYLYEGTLRGEVFKRALAEFGRDRVQALAVELGALNDALDRATTTTVTAPPAGV